MNLKTFDKEIWQNIINEKNKQNDYVNLIASENYVSDRVLQVNGSVLTNKYAEGNIGARFYGGCEFSDNVETLACKRLLELFNLRNYEYHCNVQPHSGSNANLAVCMAILKPTDTILGLDLQHGGHLTHGSLANFSGKIFKSISYKLDNNGFINYDEIENKIKKFKPKLLIAGGSAYSRFIKYELLSYLCLKYGVYLMADISHFSGLVASDNYGSSANNPFVADFITSTTHKTLRGPRGAFIICKRKYARIIDSAVFPGVQGGPIMNTIAAKAVAFKEAMTPQFKRYQNLIVKIANQMAQNFVKRKFNVISGGTDTHLFLLELPKNTNGKEVEDKLFINKIIVNKNSIPYDSKPSYETSGIRIGTPTLALRRPTEDIINRLCNLIEMTITFGDNKKTMLYGSDLIKEIITKYPIKDIFQD